MSWFKLLVAEAVDNNYIDKEEVQELLEDCKRYEEYLKTHIKHTKL